MTTTQTAVVVRSHVQLKHVKLVVLHPGADDAADAALDVEARMARLSKAPPKRTKTWTTSVQMTASMPPRNGVSGRENAHQQMQA